LANDTIKIVIEEDFSPAPSARFIGYLSRKEKREKNEELGII